MLIDNLFSIPEVEPLPPGEADDAWENDARPFLPRAPQTLADTGLGEAVVESLTLKFLLNRSHATGMDIARQLNLPFKLIEAELRRMKQDQLIVHRTSSRMHDYVYELTPAGYDRARRLVKITTYFGSAPVRFEQYERSVLRQKLDGRVVGPGRLKESLEGLSIQPAVFQQIGQAVRAARGLFLYGPPGNGKTSIAERICRAYGEKIWIPRTVLVDGELIRVFDPTVHNEISVDDPTLDRRWVCIERPTVVAGGELTLENLELTKIGDTGMVEAPLQIKSNCGVLVVDDFGRQRVSPTDLLNRWIVPLETQVDYLNLPSGKKLRTPFEQMIVFSTNLKPKDLVDEAFLRRIPYKVEAPDPRETEFLALLQATADGMGVRYDAAWGKALIERHFRNKRPFRYCHARDLMLQAKTACEFNGVPPAFTPDVIDQAAHNYFVECD